MSTSDKLQLEYRPLGRTGVFVSELCLGAMTFGENKVWGLPTASEQESVEILNAFAAHGGNFIDTANVYGESEEVLGRWLQTVRRESFVIATKVRGRVGPTVNDIGLSRKHILASVESSLQKLRTNYIDLYQIHSFDVATPLSETFRTLDDLVRVGKIRYIGVSNFTGHQLQKAVDLVREYKWENICCLQPQYNLMCRSTEWDLIRVCQEEGIGVIPWSPLAGGWLAGRVTRESLAAEPGSRIAWAEKLGWKPTALTSNATDHNFGILDAVKQVSTQTGKSFAQISLRWLLQKPGVTAPIIGARNVAQLKDNLGASGWSLTTEQMELLDKASYIEPPYPWNSYWNTQRELKFTPKK